VFLGHGFVAFALVAFAAHALGWDREHALAAALVAGAFGLAPDVDILYAPVGVLGANGMFAAAAGFWQAGNVVHRAVTHSLVVAPVAALVAGLWVRGRRNRRPALAGLALAGCGGLVAVALAVSGPLGAVVMAAFGAACLGLAEVARRRLSAGTVAAVALAGLATHPFGDLFTGEPPAMLYPLDLTVFAARPEPFVDPTLNLLAPLFFELAAAWLAVVAYLRLDGFSLRRFVREHLHGRAGLGAGFAAVALLLPPPTLSVSYHFVFPLLGVGLLLALPLPRVDASTVADLRAYPPRAAATGLGSVTLAVVAYTAAYLVIVG